MKKYIINAPSGVTTINNITILKRNIDITKGILVNETHTGIDTWSERTFPADYNNLTLYITNRKVDILPESTTTNTVITNDGLIGVIYQIESNYYITVVDIFEQDPSGTYLNIELFDFANVSLFTEVDNPFNKRIFICNGDETTLSTNNREIYRNGDNVYFESEMDYNLDREISETKNGYYITTTDIWNSTYKTTNIFKFYKKQFFRIIGPADLIVALDSGQDNISLNYAANILELRYLEINNENNNEDKFVRLKFLSSSTYCYIIVY